MGPQPRGLQRQHLDRHAAGEQRLARPGAATLPGGHLLRARPGPWQSLRPDGRGDGGNGNGALFPAAVIPGPAPTTGRGSQPGPRLVDAPTARSTPPASGAGRERDRDGLTPSLNGRAPARPVGRTFER